jgi:hypothetical protein
MNKKHFIYSPLAMFLMVSHQPTFSMDRQLIADGVYASIGVGIGVGLIYGFYRGLNLLFGKSKARNYDNISPEVQEWAKKALSDIDMDADTVLLKKGKDKQFWGNCCDSFIIIPKDFDPVKCSEEEMLQGLFAFKHEIGHFKNHDHAKDLTFFVSTIVLSGALSILLLDKEFSPRVIPGIAVLGYGATIAYSRYQETNADRFACEMAKTEKELEGGKKILVERADFIEHNMLTDPTIFEKNIIEEKILLGISRRLKSIQSQLPGVAHGSLEEKTLQNNKKTFLRMAHHVVDKYHPYLLDRSDMIQLYRDKWDKKHTKKVLLLQSGGS